MSDRSSSTVGIAIIACGVISQVGCAFRQRPNPRGAWSGPTAGLKVRLVSDRAVYEEGQYVWLWLDTLNVSGKAMCVAYGSSLGILLRLTDAENRVLKPVRLDPPGNVGVRSIAPGKQTDLMLFFVSGNQHATYAPLKPGRYRATWSVEPGAPIKGGRLAPSASVSFEVVPKGPPGRTSVGMARDVPWGEPDGGLRTRLRADGNTFAAGEPIPVTVEVRNIAKKTLHYHVPQIAMNGRIDVKDSAGRRVPYVHDMAQTMNPLLSLEAGQAHVLEAPDLASYYFLRKPGAYTARWPGAKAWGVMPAALEGMPAEPRDSDLPGTNTFAFRVLPSDCVELFDLALGALLASRPREWRIDAAPPVSRLGRPGSQWSRVPCRQYRFEHREMYGDGRLDRLQIHPITLYLALERAVGEPWDLDAEAKKKRTQYLGRGPFGYAYLAPVHDSAAKRWPSVTKDIRECLKLARPTEVTGHQSVPAERRPAPSAGP